MSNQTSTHPVAAATLTAASRFQSGPGTSFRAHMRAESAAHLAATGRPLRRMSVAASLRRAGTEADGRNTVPFWVSPSGYLMAQMPDSGTPERANADLIARVFDRPRYLPMPLDANVAGSMRVMCENEAASLRAAGDTSPRRDLLAGVAREINVAVRLPATSRLLVLSRALAHAYWLPADRKSEITAWLNMLGVTNDAAGWRSLAKDVLDPEPLGNPAPSMVHVQHKAIEKVEDSMSNTIRKGGATAAAELYGRQESLGEAWSCIERMDPLLRPQFVASGEIVALSNARMVGTKVEANMASPCKVRPGEVLVIFDGGDTREAILAGLDFDSLGLVGVFRSNARSARQSNTGQATTLTLMTGSRCYITAKPFGGAARSNSVFRWVTKNPEHLPALTPLDIPLDVAIAGAPVGD